MLTYLLLSRCMTNCPSTRRRRKGQARKQGELTASRWNLQSSSFAAVNPSLRTGPCTPKNEKIRIIYMRCRSRRYIGWRKGKERKGGKAGCRNCVIIVAPFSVSRIHIIGSIHISILTRVLDLLGLERKRGNGEMREPGER